MKYRNKQTGEIVEKRWVFWPFIGITREWVEWGRLVPFSDPPYGNVRHTKKSISFHAQYEPVEENRHE